MNQVFDFKRWLLLTGKHWSENRKKYLLSMVAMVALMIIWYSFVFLVEFNQPFPEEMQVSTYYVGMAIVGCLFGSMLFGELASGPKAMHYLSVPASALEKLLCALFYGIVLFFLVYTVIFYLVDFTMIKIGNGILQNYWSERDAAHVYRDMEVVNVFTKPIGAGEEFPPLYYYFMVIYINLQSAFILGSIYFPGYSFVKTCISLLVLFLVMVFLVANILDGFMPSGSFDDGFFAFRVNEGGSFNRVARIPGWMGELLKIFFMYGFLPILWLATYFRLKEKEV